jgi:hypothetical protein
LERIWKEAGVVMALFRYHPSIFVGLHKNPTVFVSRLWYGQSAVQIHAVAIFLSSPKCPDQPWGSSSLISDGHRCSFPGGQVAGGIKLTTCLHLVLRVKNEWSSTSSTLYAVVMCTGTSSPLYLSRFAVIWLRYEPWITLLLH